MATRTTYLLVSGVDNPEDVRSHSIVAEHGLEVHDGGETKAEGPTVTFVKDAALEDADDLSEGARTLSSAFPAAVVQLCVVEERFDQVEHLRSVLFREGSHAGEIEHGYVLNIGAG